MFYEDLGSSWLLVVDLVGILVDGVVPHTEVVGECDGRYIG
jgi:hypothetical protein